ncbi:MAG: hypothetical protein SGJ27_15220 [Candidatus Melainabacteria bacterium]|nr:hypothetical protein [Candidatus Melainabacteria bacterium]
MLPAFLIRAAVDYVRHSDGLKDSNPYSRCEEALNVSNSLWLEKIGRVDKSLLEVAAVTAYWEEFFHAEDALHDEREWREGLAKRSSNYDSFEEWQEWFKKSYAQVYQDNNIWTSVLMTSWAHTHQYQLMYNDREWDFRPSKSYLPTSQTWRMERHISTVQQVLADCWRDELRNYAETGFKIEEESIHYLGRIECLGFDTHRHILHWPVHADQEPEPIDVGEMVADIVVPVGDNWYRHPDNIIFAHDHVDVTALINRAKYILGSKRRVLELRCHSGHQSARQQATAEGWMVNEEEAEVDLGAPLAVSGGVPAIE